MKKLLLLSIFSLFVGKGFSQCYTVSQITYAPDSFNVGTAVHVLDDHYSGAIPIPFSFCYYGNMYSQCLIGSNGVVCFDVATWANSYCIWPIPAAIPSTSDPLNSIFFPWQDLYTDTAARMFYTTYGTSPNRRFVVSFYHDPMYSCTNLEFTGEVMLYETSNVIEMHIQNKTLCVGWNGGYAIMGMQNASGTVGDVVPGRNYPSQWTTSNDAWRFTPNCCSVGIPTSTINSALDIFPNPAANEIHIHYQNPQTEKFSVELVDFSGRIVFQDECSEMSERTLKPNVAAGIYLVRLINESGEVLETKRLAIE